jgi:hypothetical protein
MRSYRIARRSFLAGIGGAFGLQTILHNLEVCAAAAPVSPPRFLMMHWPVGTIRHHYLPAGSGTNWTTSRILMPFETAGLKPDMTVFYGLRAQGNAGGGGGHEAGTPLATTGANCPGTRRNGGEPDDACAGGPSFDQIFLKHVVDLQRPGAGYANAICDERIDSLETSTRCLSYGYGKQAVTTERPTAGGSVQENIPLLPILSPLTLYTNLFSNFMPGGNTGSNQAALVKSLKMRKSVLDYAIDELGRLRTLAPAGEASAKIDFHTEAIRKIERQLAQQIADPGTVSGCTPPAAPDPAIIGKSGSRNDYGRPQVTNGMADDVLHEQIGKTHMGIIQAAFQCDLIRVATFQWSPGTNHVSFKGQYPGEPSSIYMHHPLSHRVQRPGFFDGDPPTNPDELELFEFLANVNTWYNQKTAELLVGLKNATDSYGGKLLDHTIVPYVTEVAEANHSRNAMPAMIFGGKALGMRHGQFINQSRGHNDLWATIAQAYFKTTNPLGTPALQGEVFVKQGVQVFPNVWSPPT